jgi:hypothetical protein
VSLALGTLLLDEQLHESAAGVVASLLAFAVVVAGITVLAAGGGEGGRVSVADAAAP